MRRKESDKKEALKKIKVLFDEARLQFLRNPSLSNRYVTLARKIAMKFRVKIPRELKRKFCKHCYHYLVPGKNCRVRIYKSKVIYSCFNCKKFMRFMLKK
jgi:ribonuclease P protein subunit RPR2